MGILPYHRRGTFLQIQDESPAFFFLNWADNQRLISDSCRQQVVTCILLECRRMWSVTQVAPKSEKQHEKSETIPGSLVAWDCMRIEVNGCGQEAQIDSFSVNSKTEIGSFLKGAKQRSRKQRGREYKGFIM